MRFTSRNDLPPSELIAGRREVVDLCRYLDLRAQEGAAIGMDTETDGLSRDGLDVEVHYLCLADDRRRIAVPVSMEHRGNLEPIAKMLEDTQHRHATFNCIYDWNALYGTTRWKRGWDRPLHLENCLADGLKLFCLFDEEGEDTHRERGLKARARFWINLPMNSFDHILNKGGILKAMEQNRAKALDYCTRDAWAHLGVVLTGIEITKQMPWCMECPECGKPAFTEDRGTGRFKCRDHGWIRGKMLTMWDWHRRLDIPLMRELQRIQLRGIPVDTEYLEGCVDPLRTELARALRSFQAAASAAIKARGGEPVEVHPGSDKQMRRYLFEDKDVDGNVVGLGLPVASRTKTGGASVNNKSINKLIVKHNPPGATELLRYRAIEKLLSTYVVGFLDRVWDKTGRIHGKLRPVTVTGRLASADPNLQNLQRDSIIVETSPPVPPPPPAEVSAMLGTNDPDRIEEFLAQSQFQSEIIDVNIRRAVRADPGKKLICCDYSQLEVRLTAMESGDPDLIRVLNDGLDMHCYTASRAFEKALHGLTYEDFLEVKKFSDGKPELRMDFFSRLRDMEHEKQIEEAVAPRLATLASSADRQENLKALFDALSYASVEEIPEEILDAALRCLGLRDKEIANLRTAAKRAVFGIIYGIGPTGLAVQITEATGVVTSPQEAKPLIESIMHDIFPGIGRMVNRLHASARRFGYVRTACGRYRHPSGITSGDGAKVARACRQAQNAPIQGAAADVVQIAMLSVALDEQLHRLGLEMIDQVHDEILSEVPEEHAEEALELKIHIMETSHGLDTPVPLTVTGDVADTWVEAK